MRRFTPRREWAPMSDAEWEALEPYCTRPASTPGRPLLGTDPRGRMDAMFRAAVSGEPWRLLPEAHGKGATVARHFRRLAHAGLWSRLLVALTLPGCPPALRDLEYWICRVARRAMRLLKVGGLYLARRLGLLSALPMWPWLMPDPDLSEALLRHSLDVMDRAVRGRGPPPGYLDLLGRCIQAAGGRPVWSKRFAPP
jgi:transposase